MKTLASAGFAYIRKFIWFIFLALIINIGLTITYYTHITGILNGENLWIGAVTIATVTIFPILWLLSAKAEALLSAIFKVVDNNLEGLVGFIIDTFVAGKNRDKIGDYTSILKKQSTITQLILEFFFEKIDFFNDVSELLKEKNYSDAELKIKMVERIREKELFEEWEPSFMTPLGLIFANISIIYIAEQFL
ncbi:MAG: hypothetical protein KAG56_08890 [Sulfurovaceae bacterium]|nr:hypothetical protein [Sulfurovaceae bacterium]